MTNSSPEFKSYSELIKLKTFDERFEYLALNGTVAEDTLGYMRYLAQRFYATPEWKQIRDKVIERDNGCELGVDGYFIHGAIYIHHINPITRLDIQYGTDLLRDLDNLICCSYDVHQAIHYGNKDRIPRDPVVRRPNDTCPWKE